MTSLVIHTLQLTTRNSLDSVRSKTMVNTVLGLLLRVPDANENTLFIECFVSHCVIV